MGERTLEGKRIVLGVTGGIAVYKACELARLYKKAGAEVKVVMTENAAKFVCPLTFETLTGNAVYSDTFLRAREIEHISLAKFADICVIAPATANILAKAACGIADDLLSTTITAMPCPVLFAPAMNTVMWKSAANTANVHTLESRGFYMVGPESGMLACGDADIGRMSEPETIFEATSEILSPKADLKGLNILVTAGPTREMLDPVRFLSNRSTGKMGYAVAERAVKRGAEVTLVSGPVNIQPPDGVKLINIVSTNDLYNVVTEKAQSSDVVIQAAAPADFTPGEFSESKIKKTGDGMTLSLVSTPDVAAAIGKAKCPGQILVAFAAETDADYGKADAKRKRKNADIIVLNDVTKPGAGFAGDTNIITLISDSGAAEYPLMSKKAAADIILDSVLRLKQGDTCATQR